MASIVHIDTKSDRRGALTVVDPPLPFSVDRIYFVHSVPHGAVRGGHSHKSNRQALICVSGSCEVQVRKGVRTTTYRLDSRELCLLLDPGDWHEMTAFTPDAVLMVMASEPYDPEDYVRESKYDRV